MSKKVDTLANVTLAVAALVIAVAVVQREFRSRAFQAKGSQGSEKPSYLEEWKEILPAVLQVTSPSNVVQIVEFADLECAFCALWHKTVWREIEEKHGDDVSLGIVHLLLPSHRFARQSAVAVECAAAQGKAEEMLSAVYAKQDSIGLLHWSVYSQNARIPDLQAFDQCIKATSHPRIEAGQEWAKNLRIQGTPTFVVNGWRMPSTLTAEDISEMVAAIKSGENPFPVSPR